MSRFFWYSLALVSVAICTACSDEPQTPDDSVTDKKQQVEPGPVPFAPSVAKNADPVNAENGKPKPGDPLNGLPPTAAKDHAKPSLEKKTSKVDQKPPPVEIRESLGGKWILALSQGTSELYAYLLEFSQQENDSFKVNLVGKARDVLDATLEASQVQKTSVNLTLKLGEISLTFEGALTDGAVLGNAGFNDGLSNVARLIATNAKNLDQYQETQDDPAKDAFIKAVTSEKKLESLQAFVKENSQSALAFTAYEELFGIAMEKQWDAKAFDKLFTGYFDLAGNWGSRMALTTQLKVANQLARRQRLPDLALKYIEEMESKLSKEQSAAWKPIVDTAKGLALMSTADDSNQDKGADILRSVHDEDPFSPEITFALAKHAEKKKQTDEAIGFYAELTALPHMEALLSGRWSDQDAKQPLPSETVARLWKAKHGNTDGLDRYLDEVFSKGIIPFAKERVKPRPPDGGNRVVLCELFTGAECPPCVAADVATAGLEATYPKTQVVVLRYHQHVPGPDPLTNVDSEPRLIYYNGRGTPTICLNGRQVPGNVGGNLFDAEGIYQGLRELIDVRLVEKNDVKFKLSANAEKGSLKISAEVTGLKKPSDKHRLRLVLAETHVSFVARNEIRSHEMVVRAMIGGPDGIEPEEGRLAHTETIALADFKQRLADYLDKFERGQRIEFSAKPLELKHLHLVAFVQNDDDNEILQTAIIPVSGKLEYPAGSKPAKKKDSKKKPEEKPKSQN